MPLLPSNSPPTVLPADVAGVVMGYACTNPHEALQAALVSSSWHQAFLCCTDDMWGRFDVSRSRRVVPHTKPKFHDRTRFIAARSAKKLCAHVEGHVPLSSKTGNEHNHDKNKDEGLSSLALQRVRQQRIASAKIGRCYDDAKAAAAAAKETSSKRRTPTLCDLDDTLTVKPLATDGERERVITKRQVVMKPNELHPIEDCDFAFRCPIFAERLKPTSRMSEFGMPILHCDVCTRDVFVVESQEQVDYCRSNGQCVRFDKKHTDPSYCAQANVLILDAEGGSAAVQVALGILLAAAEQRQQAQTSSPLLGKRQPAVSEPYQLRLVSPTLSSPLVVDVINTDSVNRHSRSSRFCIALGTVSSESVIPSDVATIRTLSDLPEEDGDRVHKRIFSMVSFAAHDTGKLTRNVDANFCSTRRYTRNAGDANPFNPIVVPPLSDVSYGPDTTSPNSSSTAKNKSEELAQLFKNFLNTITPNRKSKKKIVPTDTDTQLIRCRMETIAAGKAAIQRMYQDLHAPVVTGGIIMPSATLSSRPF